MFKASLFMGAGALLHAVGSRFMTDMGGLRKNMRKTYIFMLLASLSLARSPPLPPVSGARMNFVAVLESGYVHALPLFGVASLLEL